MLNVGTWDRRAVWLGLALAAALAGSARAGSEIGSVVTAPGITLPVTTSTVTLPPSTTLRVSTTTLTLPPLTSTTVTLPVTTTIRLPLTTTTVTLPPSTTLPRAAARRLGHPPSTPPTANQ